MAPTVSIGSGNLEDLMPQIWSDEESWTDTSLTVSFPTGPTQWWLDQGMDPDDFTAFNAADRSNFMLAIQLWADLADFTVTSIGAGSTGQIRAFGWDQPEEGWAAKVGSSPGFNVNMDVQVNTGWINNDGDTVDWTDIMNVNQGGFKLLLHEIGHTLGLGHPGDYDVGVTGGYDDNAEYIEDSDQYTIMSYWGEDATGADFNGNAIDAPMLHDIYVIQNIYGADLTTRTGSTTYGYQSAGLATAWEQAVYNFDNNPTPVFAIWDAGGYDTLNLSGDASGVILDLRPGYFSSTHGMVDNLAIAYNPDPSAYPDLDHFIEAAVGGGGDDDITGNQLNNALEGGGGDDTLSGLGGNDFILGEAGDDWLYGGTGQDILYGGSNSDEVNGGTGDDFLYGQSGGDFLYGNSGADTVYGGTSSDVIHGGDSDETPFGAVLAQELSNGAGNGDLLFGEDGNDALHGGYGADALSGGLGNDFLQGGWGQDVYAGGSGIDTVSFAYSAVDWVVRLDLGHAHIGGVFYEQISDIENAETGSGDDTVWGTNGANVIWGNGGDDQLVGIGGHDQLFGWTGNDDIDGGSGDDTIDGWSGNDTLQGGVGDDSMLGGIGNDTLDGGPNDDTLHGGSGTDILLGNTGNDRLYGEAHRDTLSGGAGEDRLQGGTGNDDLDGGIHDDEVFGEDGNDLVAGGSGNDVLDGGDGQDILQGGPGDDFIGGGAGADTVDYAGASGAVNVDLAIAAPQLVGLTEGTDRILDIEMAVGSNGFYDTLRGTNASNKLWGLAGNDLLEGRGGNDIIDGGMGFDTASFESAPAGVAVDLANGLPQNTIGAGIDSFISIEALLGSAFGDILIGDLVGNFIRGVEGDDWIFGGEGDDLLYGGIGNDLIFGGPDNDIISGSVGSDTASYFTAPSGVTVSLATTFLQDTGGAGSDRLISMENLDGSLFDDLLSGQNGANVINGFDGDDVLLGLEGNDTLNGGLGADSLVGSAGDDTLDGGDGDDSLAGGDGNDVLLGGAGIDSLDGREGDDLIDGGFGVDAMDGGIGVDTLDVLFWNSAYEIDLVTGITNFPGETAINFENVLTGDGADVVVGTSEANFIQVNGGDDDVRAQGGDDTVEGGAGDDLLRGGGGEDLLIGGAGADRLRGDGGADELRGGSTGDKLSGGGGADELWGGGGLDYLSGGAGRDMLFGESGNDIFNFATIEEMGTTKPTSDNIGDFSPGDRIRLADIDADASTRLDDAFTFIDSLDFSGSAGELRWFQNAANTFVQCDVDGDAAVDGWLRLTGLITLSEGDFIL